jgi:uncharacterized damage-inducible protein DinB
MDRTGIKDQLLIDLDYSAWANSCLLEACRALSADEQLRDLGLSLGGVLRTLDHIFSSERYWDQYLETGALPAQEPEPEHRKLPTLDELASAWPAVQSRIRAWLGALSEAELFVRLSPPANPDPVAGLSRWQVVRHSVNHATLHRGQIVSMLRMLGKQPPSVDLLTYYLRNGSPNR